MNRVNLHFKPHNQHKTVGKQCTIVAHFKNFVAFVGELHLAVESAGQATHMLSYVFFVEVLDFDSLLEEFRVDIAARTHHNTVAIFK